MQRLRIVEQLCPTLPRREGKSLFEKVAVRATQRPGMIPHRSASLAEHNFGIAHRTGIFTMHADTESATVRKMRSMKSAQPGKLACIDFAPCLPAHFTPRDFHSLFIQSGRKPVLCLPAMGNRVHPVLIPTKLPDY